MYNFDIFKNVKNIELLQKFYVQNINILVQDFYYRGLGPIWYFQNSKSKKYLQKITPYFRLTYIFDGPPSSAPHVWFRMKEWERGSGKLRRDSLLEEIRRLPAESANTHFAPCWEPGTPSRIPALWKNKSFMIF